MTMNYRFFLNNQQVDEPVGWDQVIFAIKRMESHGIDQSFTTGLTFTGDQDRMPQMANGAGILRLAFVNEFINGSVDVRIESDFVFEGTQWQFNGLIDFTTYEETEVCDGCSDGVKVSIIEDEWRESFLRNQDVELDLLNEDALDGTDVGPFNLGQVTLHSQELYIKGFCGQLSATATDTSSADHVWPLYWQNSDFKGPFGSSFDVIGLAFSGTNVIFKNNTSFTRTFILNGKLKCITDKFSSGTGITVSIKFQIYLADGSTGPDDYVASQFLPNNSNVVLEATITDYILTLGPNESFQVLHYLSTSIQGPVVVGFIYPDENYLNWEEFNKGAASFCRGVYIYDFLDRIVTKVTGQTGKVKSEYFEYGGCEWNHLITTGLFIRNGQLLEEAEPQIPTTFQKFFEGIDKIFCLGWEFEKDGNDWCIRIEPRSYFYQRQVISTFANVSGITRRPYLDNVFGSITVGYTDNWKNTALSGIFEMHTERTYFARNKAMENGTTKKLDLRSEIIASGYAIEYSRRLQFFEDNSATSDRPNDYELFIIWLNRNEVEFEEIEGTGYEVPDQTGPFSFLPGGVSYGSNFIDFCDAPIANIYNILHTPARVAIRWWKWLGQNVYGLPNAQKKLFFQVGEYYTAMGSKLGSDDIPTQCNEVNEVENTIYENADIVQELSTETILVNPVEYTFKVPQELCDFLQYSIRGKKVIEFSCGNSNFAGFLLDSQNTPTGEAGGETEFTLIGTEPASTEGRAYSDGYSDGYS